MTEEKKLSGAHGSHAIFSLSMRKMHRDRLERIVEEAGIPSRNALLQAIAATISVEQARAFHEEAVAAGHIRKGSTPQQRGLQAELAALSPEQLRAALAAVGRS